MQVKAMEFSNISAMSKGKKIDTEGGSFLQVFNPLVKQEEDLASSLKEVDMEPIDLVADQVEEEREEIDETLAMMLNFPWLGSNQIKSTITQDYASDKSSLGGALEVKVLSQEDVSTIGDVIVDEDNVGEKAIDTQGMVRDDIDHGGPMESFEEVEGLFSKEDKNLSHKADFKEELLISEESPAVEKAIEEGDKDFPNENSSLKNFKEELTIKEESGKLKEVQWTSIQPREIQRDNLQVSSDIDSPQGLLSGENIERVNESIIGLMETRTEGGNQVMQVKLYPEELGNLDITLKMEKGQLVAKILVDNENVKQLFMNSIQNLNENLAKENIHIGDMNVDLNNQSHGHSQQEDRGSFKSNKNLSVNNRTRDDIDTHEITMASQGVSILA